MNFGRSGRLFRVLAVMFAFIALAVFAAAQSTTDGAIGGTVYDPQGAVVANAKVTVHNNATNAEQAVETDASGNYRVTKLQPAVYTVTVAAGSFSPYKAEQVVVEIGSVTTLSPHLTLGGASESVDVSAETPAINTSSADFAPVLNQTAVDNLPSNGLRWSDFAVLTPTVVNNANGFGLVSVRGQSVLLNNNTLDGADNNQSFFSEERGRTRAGYSSPATAVQEFQVNTSNYSAEYGRAAGGVVNTVTKSGTNAIHGEAYFRDRDNDFGAFNPFTVLAVQSGTNGASCATLFCTVPYKPKDWRKTMGFQVGGPIIKNKLFWSFTYDRYLRNFPGTAIPSNPSNFFGAPKAADLTTMETNLGITPAAATALYTQDLAALTTTTGTVPRKGDQSIFFPKLDWQINDKNRASVEVNRMRWASPAGIQTQATNTLGTASYGNDYVKDTWIIAKFDTFFSPTMSNEFRYQWGRDFEFENPQNPTAYEQATTVTNPLIPGYTNPLFFPPDVFFNIGSSYDIGTQSFLTRPKFPDERENQFADTVTTVRGNHTFKFGADIRHVNDISQNLRFQFGSFTYTSMGAYFSDINKVGACGGFSCYSSYQQAFGPLGFAFNTDDLGFFAQDDWKVLPRLTLNLGLRYEYEMVPKPFLSNPNLLQTAVLPKDRNNWGPRVGFAYDLMGDGKTSVRGGAGIYYGRIINSAIYNALINTGVAGGQLSCFWGSAKASVCGQAAPVFPQVINPATTTPSTAGTAVVGFDPHFQAPQIDEFDLAVQHEFPFGLVGSVTYLGSFGKQLPNFVDTNINLANTSPVTYNVQSGGPITASTYSTVVFKGPRPNTAYGAITDIVSGSTSSYNALVAELSKRFSKSIQFNTNFTWAHALDYNAANETTFTDTNDYLVPNNLRADYGNSTYNIPKRFVFNAVGTSPWHANGWLGWIANGWQLSPVYQWQNGLPFSATTSGGAPGGVGGGSAGINGSGGRKGIDILGRNSFRFPNTSVVDVSLAKSFPVKERATIELSAQAFNLLNHVNVTGMNGLAYAISTSSTSSLNGVACNLTPCLFYQGATFNTVTNADSNFAYTPRQIQLGVRLKF
ncbi:MAG TPA: carboxypeptidase regulatory-like domain-containing protein [Terriglobales bacterium]|nr:carboxypeptidase regulatory-like domain-containing protein [Terriglobales bacterium]